ncbi:hypothetical protein DPMN_154139 [Dreissena polymorpha]|uniref:Uncharacterized protein n=1 Tax=Dreissena polymorpha TaxID=45954 RepID=A0A9D4FM22_DREPO|nr:hypothetical protein DPMN_154139 [Dreissena polymorpha]
MEIEKEILTNEIKNQLKLFETDLLKLEQQYKLENKQLNEDLIISQTAAINRLREEVYLEKQACLSALEEKLKEEHEDKVERLTINVNRHKIEAVEQERRSMSERVVDLENKYGRLVRKLVTTESALAQFEESYILLQKEVTRFLAIT